MASYVEMSLDDIIQKKKKEKLKGQPKKMAQQAMKLSPKNHKPVLTKFPITDARNKIISKKRVQITDAREKLAEIAKQKDARLKLNKMRQERARELGFQRPFLPNRSKLLHRTVASQPVERVFTDRSRQVAYQTPNTARVLNRHHNINPKKFLETRTIGSKLHDSTPRPRPRPITRTVENNIEVIDDPMGEDYSPPRPTLHNRKASLELKIIAHNEAALQRSARSYRAAAPVRELSPPRPPSILKKRPMAALRSEKITLKTEKTPLEYRIIVSNLRNTVTAGDIKELFGDIGGMLESRLVRPGTAEVIYKTQEDAQKSVDLYHNRQLDGQPMNCLLVTPRAPTTMPRNSSKSALYSTNSNVEPDASTILKVLFNNQ